MYYNYHARAKSLIKNGSCIGATIFDKYNHIYPALVLYFENHKPIPIREYMWDDYIDLLRKYRIKIHDERLS